MTQSSATTGSAKQQQQALRIQQLLERSLAERQALLRSHELHTQALRQWTDIFDRLRPVIDAFGLKTAATIGKGLEELRLLQSSTEALCDALDAADADRIEDKRSASSASSGSRAMVSPLDVLSRGAMGAAVGTLVNALRMHGYSLRDTARSVGRLREGVRSALEEERAHWSGVQASLDTGAERTLRLGYLEGDAGNPVGAGASGTRDVRNAPRRRQSADSAQSPAQSPAQSATSRNRRSSIIGVSSRPVWNKS